jgi:hypothetical protein
MSVNEFLRILLIADILVMDLLAVFYLRNRQLSWLSFCAWGLLAFCLPVIGPFLVIAWRPGQPR